jgi:hypothetical protein
MPEVLYLQPLMETVVHQLLPQTFDFADCINEGKRYGVSR